MKISLLIGAVLAFSTISSGSWAGPLFSAQESRVMAPAPVKSDAPALANQGHENLKNLIEVLNQCVDLGLSDVGGGNDGHITVKVPASASRRPTLDGCPEGSTVSGTDSVGTITIGPGGGNSCEVVFGTPFDEAPTCVVSDSVAHPTPKMVTSSPDRFEFQQVSAWNTTTNNFSGQVGVMLGGEKVKYICIGFSK